MKVDQFESVFRAAAKEPYKYTRVEFERILVITDLESAAGDRFCAEAQGLLSVLGDSPKWSILNNADFGGVESLLGKVHDASPDLIVTYRNLQSDAWKWPYTLGEHLDVLTQIAEVPMLVTPHPLAGRASDHSMQSTNLVMAITDHLTGDHRLVNVAARLTAKDGNLLLAHIENEQAFEHYMETISKIDPIETESARETISRQLLKFFAATSHTVPEVSQGTTLIFGAIPVQEATVMKPPADYQPDIFENYKALLGEGVEWTEMERWAFYDKIKSSNTCLVIATGEQRRFANLPLTVGVVKLASESF